LNREIQFFVSTISDDPKKIFENLPIYESLGISGIHFDVMDGSFVPRIGLYPELLSSIRSTTNLPIEVHLMLQEPDNFIQIFRDNGANRILVHLESLQNPSRTLDIIKSTGAKSCIVLNPSTDFSSLKNYIDKIDSIMLMAINPGIPKHPFIPSTHTKLNSLKIWAEELKPNLTIGIDGGVTFENARSLYQNGADWLVCGSGTFFRPGFDLQVNINDLKKKFQNS
jgi:ribulose-phosphate 3-epimerase